MLASALRGPLVDVLQPSDEPDEPLAIADVVRMMPVERPDIPQKCCLNDCILVAGCWVNLVPPGASACEFIIQRLPASTRRGG